MCIGVHRRVCIGDSVTLRSFSASASACFTCGRASSQHSSPLRTPSCSVPCISDPSSVLLSSYPSSVLHCPYPFSVLLIPYKSSVLPISHPSSVLHCPYPAVVLLSSYSASVLRVPYPLAVLPTPCPSTADLVPLLRPACLMPQYRTAHAVAPYCPYTFTVLPTRGLCAAHRVLLLRTA